jgi:phage gpG-like protein
LLSIRIQLSERGRRLIDDRQGLTRQALDAMARAMHDENMLTVAAITRDKLSFPKKGPSVPNGLRVRTGRLRRSIRSTYPVVATGGIVSSIGTNVEYAGIHEFGGTVPPHTIRPKTAKALAFTIRGKKIIRKSVRHPGATYPARRYIQSTIEERVPQYEQALSNAVVQSLQ